MPAKREWTDAENTRLRQMRSEGEKWDAINAAFGASLSNIREQAARIGALPPPPEFVRETVDPGQRVALPAGHPATWGILVAGTALDDVPYPVPSR